MKSAIVRSTFVVVFVLACTALFAGDTTQLKLPSGFNVITLIDSLAKNRHIAVNTNGDIYVKIEALREGKGILVFREKNGKAELVNSFGTFAGSGIAIKKGYLYTTSDDEVFRFKFNDKNEIDSTQVPEKIITKLVNKKQHAAKTITLDDAGNIYVNIGAPSNSCQIKDRENGSLGQNPCHILDSAGGIWQFKADKLNQTYADGVHYASGIRNAVGIFWNSTLNDLFATQHGRDGLFQMFPKLYSEQEGAELPAEELLRVKKGANFGWPYCYYDEFQHKKILAPEYGGDKKKTGKCSLVDTPAIAFPGHWAPNALLFYTGDQFPAKYKNGAFIAFHGSWNRAPLKQKGYNVAFIPFKDGKPSGPYEIFAENFKGAEELDSPGDAVTRPCGLAQGPDGSLYISDDVKGSLWKIVYSDKK